MRLRGSLISAHDIHMDNSRSPNIALWVLMLTLKSNRAIAGAKSPYAFQRRPRSVEQDQRVHPQGILHQP
jgi:hypothetical protein